MKNISRRDFLRFCGIGAAALGLSISDLGKLHKVLASTTGPKVIWLQGAGCTGCSESFLNRISTSAPVTASDVLINSINLVYHPTLMASAGQDAVAQVESTYTEGGYILAVEGGIPTSFGGHACAAWTYNNVEVTFQDAVMDLATKASNILCIGTCASWGGIPAAPPNPAGIKGVSELTRKSTINISGCPPHPDWIVWTILQLILGNQILLDNHGRPQSLFQEKIHSKCPRKESEEGGDFSIDGHCLEDLGCRGKETRGICMTQLWNNKVNWCIDANSPCIGCTEPTFPGTLPFYRSTESED
jgi:hydrogenase small subunit